MHDRDLNRYERAIVSNADWFIARQTREGYIDAEGDEFYGIHGDATLVGHSVTVRCYASVLTGSNEYLESARRSLDWLAKAWPQESQLTGAAILHSARARV